jgi:hypothetical protein
VKLEKHLEETSRRAAPHSTNEKTHSATAHLQPSLNSEGEEESDSVSAGVRKKNEYTSESGAVHPQEPEGTGRLQRVRRPPAKLTDFVTD